MSEWIETTVGDVVARCYSGPSPTCDERNIRSEEEWGLLKTTAVTWAGWNEFAHKVPPRIYWSNKTIEVRPGDVVITKAGPRHRVGVVVDVPSTQPRLMVSGKMIGLTPKITTVLPRILAGVLATREPQKYLDQRTTGMAESQVNFTNEVLLSTPIRVPAMREQRRIAEILDTVDDAIHSTDRLIRKLELTKQGLLDDLLTRGLDERGELRDPDRHPGQFIRTAIGPLPAAWELLPVHRHFDAKLGKMLSPASKTGRQMFPYLANRNVQWDRLDLSDLDEMEFSGQEREKYQLEFGDVLVCEGGEVGRTAVWRNAMPNCYFQKAVHRLRSRGEILPEYFSAYMRFAASTGRFSHLSSQTSIAHLTAEKLAQLLVPTPSVGEQRSIVGLLMAASEQSAGCSAERDKLRVLKAGLMDDLLTGRVHVSSAEHAA